MKKIGREGVRIRRRLLPLIRHLSLEITPNSGHQEEEEEEGGDDSPLLFEVVLDARSSREVEKERESDGFFLTTCNASGRDSGRERMNPREDHGEIESVIVASPLLRFSFWQSYFPSSSSSSSDITATFPKRVRIGKEWVVTAFNEGFPLHPELVPWDLAPEGFPALSSSEMVSHLSWMAKKDALGQDMFLLGPPGPLRRWLAYTFCALMGKEVEYVSLSRDTTESDIKQRREIRNGSVVHYDQPPVLAALNGRVLILDGIEKCERNVLPLLNNLLENREMNLDDGRFLMMPQRYDQVFNEDRTSEESRKEARGRRQHIERVDPRFRVIALGVPVPQFPGNPMDPPLRSRFQARDVRVPSGGSLLQWLSDPSSFSLLGSSSYSLDPNLTRQIVALSEALRTGSLSHNSVQSPVISPSQEQNDRKIRLAINEQLAGVPHFPDTGAYSAVRFLRLFPNADLPSLLHRIYPYHLCSQWIDTDQLKAIENIIMQFFPSNLNSPSEPIYGSFTVFDRRESHMESSLLVPSVSIRFTGSGEQVTHHVVCGSLYHQASTQNNPSLSLKFRTDERFVETQYNRKVLLELLQDHCAGFDVCIVGPNGSGKSAIAKEFGRTLFYHGLSQTEEGEEGMTIETVHLYKDMTTRDIFQRRSTGVDGDTRWEISPLVRAALTGGLAILDGLDRLPPSSISGLQSLIQERECPLFDGTRIVRWDRFDRMVERLGVKEVEARGFKRCHPGFRIVALASLPTRKNKWLSSELMAMFRFHLLRSPTREELLAIASTLHPTLNMTSVLLPILKFNTLISGEVTGGPENDLESIAKVSLSLRQFLRVCRRMERYPKDNLKEAIKCVMLDRFLPASTREFVDQTMSKCGIHGTSLADSDEQWHIRAPETPTQRKRNIEVTDEGKVKIGSLSFPRRTNRNAPELIPNILFFEIPKHVYLLEQMAKDFVAGEHLLLIGNQGVGKNKLADKLLEVMNVEREYVQLHRDTTLQSLTVIPEVEAGVVVWLDSPLVRAAKEGRCLVIDEADKAPLEVVVLLKALVQDGEMPLFDGRRLSMHLRGTPRKTLPLSDRDDIVIPIHPEFRLIVLANRPGFPFLGNDFFAELGDCFSCHTIDNPDNQSELLLLKSYAPNVPDSLLRRLTLLFDDLRKRVDEGVLSYPYSTRELVNVVKHLQLYQKDGLVASLSNTFSFDSYDPQLREHLIEIFHRHGVPIESNFYDFRVDVSPESPIPELTLTEQWKRSTSSQPVSCRVESTSMIERGKWTWRRDAPRFLKGRTEGRIHTFTEEKFSWNVVSQGQPLDALSLSDGSLHILLRSPWEIQSFDPSLTSFVVTRLDSNIQFYGTQDPATTLFPISSPTSNATPDSFVQTCFALCMPLSGLVMVFDTKSETISALEIPGDSSSEYETRVAVYNERVFIGRSNNVPKSSDVVNSNPNIVLPPRIVKQKSGENRSSPITLIYKPDSTTILLLDFTHLLTHTVQLPGSLYAQKMIPLTHCSWLLVSSSVRSTTPTPSPSSSSLPSSSPSSFFSTNAPSSTMKVTVPSPSSLSTLGTLQSFICRWDSESRSFSLHSFEVVSLQSQCSPSVTLERLFFAQSLPSRLVGSSTDSLIKFVEKPLVTQNQWIADVRSSLRVDKSAVTSDLRTSLSQLIHLERESPLLLTSHYSSSSELTEEDLRRNKSRKAYYSIPKPKSTLDNLSSSTSNVRPTTPILSSSTIATSGVQAREEKAILEVVNLQQKTIRTISLLTATKRPHGALILALSERPDGDVVILHQDGTVRVLELETKSLNENIKSWKQLVGVKDKDELKDEDDGITFDFDEDESEGNSGEGNGEGNETEATGPSEGILDNLPHIGGNTFRRGTGGVNTPGVGGKGGSRRMESIAKRKQMLEEVKLNMSEEVRRAQQEASQLALRERLKEIEMSEYEFSLYEQILRSVSHEISQLRVVLEGVEAKKQERVWMKNKTSGELDDRRLVDGLVGEKTIYRRRGDKEPDSATFQEKPKRLEFVVDCSASMFHFNATDSRLDRLLESVVMITEALQGFEHKYLYSIVGHSGDGPSIPFVQFGKPPANPKERFRLLQKMKAHSEYCASGDETLRATELAIQDVVKEEADDYFVFVLSDANLRRYGLSPGQLSQVMTKDKQVSVFIIFIGSLADEAAVLKSQLPFGKAHVCLDTTLLPAVFRQIFASSVLR